MMKKNSKIKKVIYFLGIQTALWVLCVSMSFAQQITGTVVDVKNEPLIGASVVLEGTTKGAITDTNGAFTLAIEKSEVLLVLKNKLFPLVNSKPSI
jgi:TonB-dependent starch-binding outer membrane protein SusC